MNSDQRSEIASYPVQALEATANRQKYDAVAVEAPLEVRFGGRPITVLMRTPGNDEELVLGFLFSEGIIKKTADILAVRRPEGLPENLEGNVIDIQFDPTQKRSGLHRAFFSSSSCGACGKQSIASLDIPADPLEDTLQISRNLLGHLPDRSDRRSPCGGFVQHGWRTCCGSRRCRTP